MGDFTFTIDKAAWENTDKAFKLLNQVAEGEELRKELGQYMKPIIDQGKSNLRTRNKKKTGNLLRSFFRVTLKKKIKTYAGFRRTRKNSEGGYIAGGNHAHLVDRGTKKRWTKKGYYRGSVAKKNPQTGTNFWTNAVEQEGPKVLNKIINSLDRKLTSIKNKYNLN